MRITYSDDSRSAFSLVGNLGSTATNTSELIFVYPVLIDTTLDKEWGYILRKFITTQFISQIKTSNILNITRSATRSESTGSSRGISPGETLAGVLSNVDDQNPFGSSYNIYSYNQTQDVSAGSSQHHPRDLEGKIRQNLDFIKSQVLNDPKYSQFLPAFSLVTVEHLLIEIPLILGTVSKKLPSQPLFWLLFLALTTHSRLDNSRDINRIYNNIDSIPKRRYIQLLTNATLVTQTERNFNDDTAYSEIERRYSALRRDSDTGMHKVGDTFNKFAGSISNFEAEIGISTNFASNAQDQTSITIANVLGTNTGEKAEFKAKAISTFNQGIVTSLFPVMQTINNMLVQPGTEINFEGRYRYLLREINRVSNDMLDTIIGIIQAAFGAEDGGIDFANNFENICIKLHNINPSVELSKLSSIAISYSDIQDIINVPGGNNRVFDFGETLDTTTARLTSKIETITSQMEHFVRGNVQQNFASLVTDYNNRIRNLINEFYFSDAIPEDQGHNIIPRNQNNRNQISNIFASIFHGVNQNQFDNFLISIQGSTTSIASFLFFYSALGYLCDYIRIVKKDVELKKNDVIAFPNYILVVPYEYISSLYYAFAIRNLKELSNPQTARNAAFRDFSFNQSDEFKIILGIINRLNAPNIVVVDSKRKLVWYKWRHSKSVQKVNRSTIENYIKSQSNIINAF